MGEVFCSRATAAASGCSPKTTTVHMVSKRKAFVVEGGYTDTFAKRVGGEGEVSGFPMVHAVIRTMQKYVYHTYEYTLDCTTKAE